MNSSDLPVPENGASADAWAALANDVDKRYRLQLERTDAESSLRYVAVARSLDVRPYAVVTTELDELRRALGQGNVPPCTSEAQPPASGDAERSHGRTPLGTPGGLI
jgi:hypothetical protein